MTAIRRAGLPAAMLALLAALALALCLPLLAGPLAALWRAAPTAAGAYDPDRMRLLYSTLPRFAMALLCGGALAASGALLQQALRNPLASPTTLGVDAGGRLALAVTLLFAPALFGWGRDLVTLAGSGLSTLLVFALVRRRHFAAVSLILAGLVVGLYAGALSAMLTLLNERYLVSLFIWGSGSLSQQGWDPALQLGLRLAVLAVPVAVIVRPLALLELDDANARARGADPGRLRFLAVALAVLLSAFVVSSVGVIGFVGLVAPVLARVSGVRGFGARLALATGLGALLLLVTDAAVQAASGASGDFLPTGAVTALLGSPLLLVLLPRLRLADRPPAAAEPARRNARRCNPKLLATALVLGAILLAAFVLLVGRDPVDGRWTLLLDLAHAEAVLPWRWPRVVASFGAGAMLGVAGFLLQRLTGNEMASPEVLGVSAGAAFAATLTLFLVVTPQAATTSLAATLGSLAVIAAVFALGRRSGFQPERVILTGIALNALLDAVVGVVASTGDPRALMLFAWMAGSTSGAAPPAALAMAASAAVLVALALLAARPIAILPLGPAATRALGVPLERTRLLLFLLAAALTAAATPVAGTMTFVGLMAPHALRLVGLHRPIPALVGSALAGGALLMTADWVARVAAYPWQLPTGLVAALIGAPFLMLLLAGGRRPAS
ncbi:Fe(3+)-hydroxamate ABC transporter permease FhuB [Aureimonas pseudogalii]|uniref:Fe(3+)-hydroxamate ABC transporter permease FhuB n=1 Tax=Aureimonas pseudogalii TaxID=1744844 RepID=UPI0035EE8AC1